MSQEETNGGSEEKAELWTPPEKLDVNTQRMAWTLFLEEWKSKDPHVQGMDTIQEWAEHSYEMCLDVAKIVRTCEVRAGGS